MAWTKEQELAITTSGKNIIVSAGAGSGKTAVLTERVKQKIISGIHVNELLVLTFTNAAAQEMKDRIRDAIQKTKGLEEEESLIDGSYITTFDSFSLSMVKKYHARLNISNHIGISDEIMIDMKKRELLEKIMEKNYQNPTPDFQQLIKDFCLKDDEELKEAILSCYQKIELKYDKTHFLNHYFEEFAEEKQNHFQKQYQALLKKKQKIIKDLMEELNTYFDGDFVAQMEDNFEKLLTATTYDEFKKAMDYGTIRVPRSSPEEGKKIKKQKA